MTQPSLPHNNILKGPGSPPPRHKNECVLAQRACPYLKPRVWLLGYNGCLWAVGLGGSRRGAVSWGGAAPTSIMNLSEEPLNLFFLGEALDCFLFLLAGFPLLVYLAVLLLAQAQWLFSDWLSICSSSLLYLARAHGLSLAPCWIALTVGQVRSLVSRQGDRSQPTLALLPHIASHLTTSLHSHHHLRKKLEKALVCSLMAEN